MDASNQSKILKTCQEEAFFHPKIHALPIRKPASSPGKTAFPWTLQTNLKSRKSSNRKLQFTL
jgi:hypothetical protein